MQPRTSLTLVLCSSLAFACGSDSDGNAASNEMASGGSGAQASGGSGATNEGGSGGDGSDGSGASGGESAPSGPVVIPDLPCGGELDADLLPPYVTLGGRDVYIDYACDKPAGTPTTFILNLHGTMQLEAGKIYQRGYFPAYQYVDTHDFVIATPKSVVSQWGNGDNGADEPHLLEVIDWVYDTFSALDIQEMWVIGHSWGSFYTLNFACKPELEGRVSGVVLMSGGAGMPECADRLSVMATVGELDIVPGQPDQSATAAAHGCDPQTEYNLGNNVITEWPNCDPGWVHKNYFMIGKAHGFDPVDWPDEQMNQDMADAILSSR